MTKAEFGFFCKEGGGGESDRASHLLSVISVKTSRAHSSRVPSSAYRLTEMTAFPGRFPSPGKPVSAGRSEAAWAARPRGTRLSMSTAARPRSHCPAVLSAPLPGAPSARLLLTPTQAFPTGFKNTRLSHSTPFCTSEGASRAHTSASSLEIFFAETRRR